MIDKHFNVLVFPCGSEVGLEINKSLKNSRFITLWGASSIEDHGMYEFENYIGDLPFVDSPNFISRMASLVKQYSIDAIFPAMDTVAYILKKSESEIGCRIISSNTKVNEIALKKKLTYEVLEDIVKTPVLYSINENIPEKNFPVFLKPNVGYGSKNTFLARNNQELKRLMEKDNFEDMLIMEYLPGEEYTLDCFSDKNGNLLFVSGRERYRVKSGISVNTFRIENENFIEIAQKISRRIKPTYAWFIQLKKDKHGKLTLLEISTRLGGSSSLHRIQGVNFALLSLLTSFDYPVEINFTPFDVSLDRALTNSYKNKINYNKVYVDLDDCLILKGKLNTDIMKFIFQCINNSKKVYLITRHKGNLMDILKKYRIAHIFDEIIHLEKGERKSQYIKGNDSIFIDDSFAERKEVSKSLGILTFSPDSIEALLVQVD